MAKQPSIYKLHAEAVDRSLDRWEEIKKLRAIIGTALEVGGQPLAQEIVDRLDLDQLADLPQEVTDMLQNAGARVN